MGAPGRLKPLFQVVAPLSVVGILVLPQLSSTSLIEPVDPPNCGRGTATDEPTPSTTPSETAPLEPSFADPEEGHVIPFQRSSSAKDVPIQFTLASSLPSPDDPLDVLEGDFTRDDSATIPPAQVQTYQLLGRTEHRLFVCIDPDGVPPGSYTGSVTIDDPRLATSPVPVTVTIQYQGIFLVLLGTALVFVAALFFKWATVRRGDDRPVFYRRALGDFWRWLLDMIVGVLAAVVAAAGIFNAQYLENPSWGTRGWEFWALAGAIFSAVVAAVSANELRKPNE
jgi:hypothetical protein